MHSGPLLYNTLPQHYLYVHVSVNSCDVTQGKYNIKYESVSVFA